MNRKTACVVASVAVLLVIGTLVYLSVSLRRQLNETRWALVRVMDWETRKNAISLSVGSIQFLSSGYSVTLDSIEATPTGVLLTGRFGNPKVLSLSSVTVGFSARRVRPDVSDVFTHDALAEFRRDTVPLGKAEAQVGYVESGSNSSFRVVLPNVTGDLQKILLDVYITGERYQYLR